MEAIIFKTKFLKQLLSFFISGPDPHVRISKEGHEILKDKALASKLAKAILDGANELKEGRSLDVDGTGYKVDLVTSVSEN